MAILQFFKELFADVEEDAHESADDAFYTLRTKVRLAVEKAQPGWSTFSMTVPDAVRERLRNDYAEHYKQRLQSKLRALAHPA
jgi:hypothetical protein